MTIANVSVLVNLIFYCILLRFIVILLGAYTLCLLFLLFLFLCCCIFEQPLAEEFPSGLVHFYLILSYLRRGTLLIQEGK